VAITYPLALPTPGPQKLVLTGRTMVSFSQSPFSGVQQVNEWPAEWWEAEVSLPPMRRVTAEAWTTFLLALRGRSGTFYLGDSAAKTPRGVATGTPVVNGAGQTGKSLATRGWTISITGILKAGDYLQVGSGATKRLYKNLTDANSDGSGNATFDIFPRLRESPADGAAITLSTTQGTFRLQDNARSWDIDEALIYGIQFKALEAF
jgi:hypothetical protein